MKKFWKAIYTKENIIDGLIGIVVILSILTVFIMLSIILGEQSTH